MANKYPLRSSFLLGIAALVIAIGFVVLTIWAWKHQSPYLWLDILGSVVFALNAFANLVDAFVRRKRALETIYPPPSPGRVYRNEPPVLYEVKQ